MAPPLASRATFLPLRRTEDSDGWDKFGILHMGAGDRALVWRVAFGVEAPGDAVWKTPVGRAVGITSANRSTENAGIRLPLLPVPRIPNAMEVLRARPRQDTCLGTSKRPLWE